MTTFERLHSLRVFLATLCLGVCLSPCLALGESDLDSVDSLDLENAWQDSTVTTSRFPRPASKIAENVTVITDADIERLNAHTLAEILQTVPGIQLDYLRTPTNYSFFNIQGALNTTVLVLVDGIRQNDYQGNLAFVGNITVQQIERVEIVKGAASTAWGSALGGVINVVTKSPNPERMASGMVSGSIGSRYTADSRAELSGTLDRFGYYLTAGNFRSDGFNPGTAANVNNISGKLSYTLPGSGTVTAGLRHLNNHYNQDEGVVPHRFNGLPFGDSQKNRRTNGFLKFSQPLGNQLRLELDGYFTSLNDHGISWFVDDHLYFDVANNEKTRGVNARLSWGDAQRNLVVGAEYGHVGARYGYQGVADSMGSFSEIIHDKAWDQWSVYANGAYSIGNLTLLPGIRHDITGQAGDNTSYSLGLTYQLMPDVTLRTYAASGYSLPQVFTGNTKPQKVKTIQAGFETSRIPYLWLKGTYFYNAIRHGESAGVEATVTDQNRQGFEVELRTVPVSGFSVASAYTYLAAEDNDTERQLHSNDRQSVPPHLVKLKLNYDNPDWGFRGTLTGNYVFWSEDPAYIRDNMSDKGMLWDLHLNWKPFRKHDLAPELFFSGHNLFNGNQTTSTDIFDSAPRWFEGGVRVRF